MNVYEKIYNVIIETALTEAGKGSGSGPGRVGSPGNPNPGGGPGPAGSAMHGRTKRERAISRKFGYHSSTLETPAFAGASKGGLTPRPAKAPSTSPTTKQRQAALRKWIAQHRARTSQQASSGGSSPFGSA